MLPVLLLALTWDAAPRADHRPLLLVATPGVARQAHLPLVRDLVRDGWDVRVVELGCNGADTRSLAHEVVQAAADLPPGYPVVAHGVGATIALMAAPDLQAGRYALSAPVLDIWPVASTRALAQSPIGAAVALDGTTDLALDLLGGELPLQCVSAGLARDVQGWIDAGIIELPLEQVAAPVWLAVSLGDHVASVEAVIPASRRLPHRTVARLGINALHRADPGHGDMLTGRVARRSLTRALRRRPAN